MINKIFILIEDTYDYKEFVDVFSTLDEAKDFINELLNIHNDKSFRILERELNLNTKNL